MEGSGNPHHQRAFDMLNGHQLDDDGSDEERIRRPPEAHYEERRETAQTFSDGASVYSNNNAEDVYNNAEDEYYREREKGDGYPYPQSIIDMPSQFPPLNIPPVPSRDSRFYGSSGSPQLNFWDRFRGKGRPHVGWTESAIAIARSSWLNVLLVIVPVAWALHFVNGISHIVQFIFCFIAIIPLCRLLDYGGENLALYCGKDFGDVIVVSANNAVEATLAICLLSTCQLRLLQATIVGTVLLRLVFVPSMHFISGGARIAAQDLHPHLADLNQTLLTTGVLSLLLPAAFFSALNSVDAGGESPNAVSDSVRGDLLKVSRGLAVLLLAVYLCSRIFLHNPPGSENGLHEHKDAPAEFKERAARMAEEDPEVNPWACLILLFLVVALMAPTAEFLVESIQPMSERHQIPQEFFGLILLPFVSYSAECILSLVYHVQLHLEHYLGTPLYPPKTLAEARSIELSIQFLIFWMPLLVLLAWVTNKPLSLLFDLFEVVLLLSVGFLVNYVTADAKTNWIEGVQLLALYAMMALTAWFYPGQPAVQTMLSCGSIQSFLAAEGVPPNSTFTNISFEGFHATLDDSQINNFTDRLRDLNKLYSLLKQIETGS